MTTINEIIDQISNFAKEINMASIGSFMGRTVTYVQNHPVILVAIAAIIVVGGVYLLNLKKTKTENTLVSPKTCFMTYQRGHHAELKKIELPPLPKANYFVSFYAEEPKDSLKDLMQYANTFDATRCNDEQLPNVSLILARSADQGGINFGTKLVDGKNGFALTLKLKADNTIDSEDKTYLDTLEHFTFAVNSWKKPNSPS